MLRANSCNCQPNSHYRYEHFKGKALLATCFMKVSCVVYSLTMKIEETCFSEMSVAFIGLHSVISQKIEFFITTAVRTSDHTFQRNMLPLSSGLK
jgi:hypothetical protein